MGGQALRLGSAGGRVPRLEQAGGPRIDLGSYCLGNCTVGKLPLGKTPLGK